MTRRTLVLVAVMTMALASQPASAGGPNQGSGITAIPIVTGLAYPAAFTIAPDGRSFFAGTADWVILRFELTGEAP